MNNWIVEWRCNGEYVLAVGEDMQPVFFEKKAEAERLARRLRAGFRDVGERTEVRTRYQEA
ncbi:MAG: hypothetical protein ISN29_11460 [Gammaproteobacteria bacterium AqS3]|nr:hypothetical protein [Gammaproteobacteria bacterium AqS3]